MYSALNTIDWVNLHTRPIVNSDYAYIPRSHLDVAEECSICKSGYQAGDLAFVSPCSHVYHRDCILEWVNEKATCPMCRKDFSKDIAYHGSRILFVVHKPDTGKLLLVAGSCALTLAVFWVWRRILRNGH